VIARNQHDYGFYSDEISVLAAQMPNKPLAPTLQLVDDDLKVSWTAPFNGGSPITGYRIYLRKLNGAYIQDFSHCDGSLDEIKTSLSCRIPTSTFI
jgi:hypothetical protein